MAQLLLSITSVINPNHSTASCKGIGHTARAPLQLCNTISSGQYACKQAARPMGAPQQHSTFTGHTKTLALLMLYCYESCNSILSPAVLQRLCACSTPVSTALEGPLKSKKKESRLANMDSVHPVCSYPVMLL